MTGHNLPSDLKVNISILSEHFEIDDVTIILEWTLDDSSLITYSFSVIPQTAVTFSGGAMAQLTIPYNTLYNVSISATVLCGRKTTTSIRLNHSE